MGKKMKKTAATKALRHEGAPINFIKSLGVLVSWWQKK
jgi:hypothetical protein